VRNRAPGAVHRFLIRCVGKAARGSEKVRRASARSLASRGFAARACSSWGSRPAHAHASFSAAQDDSDANEPLTEAGPASFTSCRLRARRATVAVPPLGARGMSGSIFLLRVPNVADAAGHRREFTHEPLKIASTSPFSQIASRFFLQINKTNKLMRPQKTVLKLPDLERVQCQRMEMPMSPLRRRSPQWRYSVGSFLNSKKFIARERNPMLRCNNSIDK
jgi:hypothetical protein